METKLYLLGRSEHICFNKEYFPIYIYFFPKVVLYIYLVLLMLSHLLCNFLNFIHISSHGILPTHVSKLVPSIPDTRPVKHAMTLKQSFKCSEGSENHHLNFSYRAHYSSEYAVYNWLKALPFVTAYRVPEFGA